MRQNRNKLQRLAAVATAIGLTAAAPATADERADLDLRFSTEATSASAGITVRVVYKKPGEPEAKPPALTKAAFDLPAGTRVDTGALPQCTAGDDELRARGRAACPPDTRIGEGTFVGITGAGPPADPFVGDIVAFNGRDQIIELVLVKGTDTTAGFDRLTVEGETLVAHPPATPGGPPDGRTVPRSIDLTLDPGGAAGRPYLRTPGECPAGGQWVSRGRFEFLDGGVSAVAAPSACSATTEPALRLRVAPAVVQAGRRAVLRARLTADDPGCAAGATVRLGRARATTDARGRAVLRKVLSTPRAVTVRAAKRGCGRATATVRVEKSRR